MLTVTCIHCSCFRAHLWNGETKTFAQIALPAESQFVKSSFLHHLHYSNINATMIGWWLLATVHQLLSVFSENITEHSSNARCWKFTSYLRSTKCFRSLSTCSNRTIFSTCQIYCGFASCDISSFSMQQDLWSQNSHKTRIGNLYHNHDTCRPLMVHPRLQFTQMAYNASRRCLC